MSNILFVGLEYEDSLRLSASLRYAKIMAEVASIFINENNIDDIDKLYFRELISEQIGFANCFLNDNELKTITIDSFTKNKKDIKILDILESKRKYNKFLKEKL